LCHKILDMRAFCLRCGFQWYGQDASHTTSFLGPSRQVRQLISMAEGQNTNFPEHRQLSARMLTVCVLCLFQQSPKADNFSSALWTQWGGQNTNFLERRWLSSECRRSVFWAFLNRIRMQTIFVCVVDPVGLPEQKLSRMQIAKNWKSALCLFMKGPEHQLSRMQTAKNRQTIICVLDQSLVQNTKGSSAFWASEFWKVGILGYYDSDDTSLCFLSPLLLYRN